MSLYRLILPEHAKDGRPKVIEGELTQEQVDRYNAESYNVYYTPNGPSHYEPGKTVDGTMIDQWRFVFVDMDLKDQVYPDKDSFIEVLAQGPEPTYIVDSGNGIHAYWQVSDLDAMNYLRLQRRLMRKYKTDDAVAKIFQLMRVPGSVNTKDPENPKLCEMLLESDAIYTCGDLSAHLPPITHEDEAYCQQHYAKTYSTPTDVNIDDKIPLKFAKLVRDNPEVKAIWSGGMDDRSTSDYRLGHIMFADCFSKEEAMSVLVNTPKALARAPKHRVSYAENIVDKIWLYELSPDKGSLDMSSSVKDILSRKGTQLKGVRFPCHSWIDATEHGFRLGQVLGLIAGSGVGKTAVTLNLFLGFVKNNPDYDHFFVSLEQPAEEIADRWRSLCGDNETLHDKVHVLSNYGEDGTYRNLSLSEIKDYVKAFQAKTGRKIGCIVVDHIGALKKKTQDGENQGIMEICHEMKGFAVETGTFLIMQSQSSREKAGIGDLEIGKDAAYGTVFFESYCDYAACIWQPLKRCYSEEGCPTVTAFKLAKIRHKNQKKDKIKEDVCYKLFFEPETGQLREMTQNEETSFTFFLNRATNKRKQDRKTDLVEYTSIKVADQSDNASDVSDLRGAG